MNNIEIEELVMLSREMNEDAFELLEYKFNKIVDYFLRKYSITIRNLNIDIYDLKSYCMENFLVALNTYCSLNRASFLTYAYLLIDRAIKRYFYKYRKINNEIVFENLDNICDKFSNVEKTVFNKIKLKALKAYIDNKFNGIDKRIALLTIDGYRCIEISKILKIDYKKCYRKMKKIKNVLKLKEKLEIE